MITYKKRHLAIAVRAINALTISATTLAFASGALAQGPAGELDEVVVTGIRASLANALDEKRAAVNLIEVIQS